MNSHLRWISSTVPSPWAVFTCSRTLIQTHWYLPTVPCSESEQSDIHDHPFEKSKLGFQLSQVWYPKAGCPARLSLLCFDEVKSHTVTADEYLFWMTLSKFASIIWWAGSLYSASDIHVFAQFPCDFRHWHLRMTSGPLWPEIFEHVCAMTKTTVCCMAFV